MLAKRGKDFLQWHIGATILLAKCKRHEEQLCTKQAFGMLQDVLLPHVVCVTCTKSHQHLTDAAQS